MTSQERIIVIFDNVKLEIGDNVNVSDDLVKRYVTKIYAQACEVTNYNTESLPISFDETIVDVVVEAIHRKKSEGIASESDITGSSTYSFSDTKKSLKSKLKGKKNPKSITGVF